MSVNRRMMGEVSRYTFYRYVKFYLKLPIELYASHRLTSPMRAFVRHRPWMTYLYKAYNGQKSTMGASQDILRGRQSQSRRSRKVLGQYLTRLEK